MFRWRRRFFGIGAAFPRISLGKDDKVPAPLWILAGIALFAFAAYAGPVLIPLLAAISLYYLFAPLKRRLARAGIGALPVAVAAPLLIITLLFAGFSALAGPVGGWIGQAPAMVYRLQQHVEGLMGPVQRMREATGQVEKIGRPNGQPAPTEVAVKPRGLVDRIFGGLSDFVVSTAATLMLLFYLLMRPAPPERAMVGFARTFAARRRFFRAIRDAESDLSRYLQTVTLINICVGVLLATVFHFIGLPGAFVLGAMVGLLSFVPLLGAVASIVLTLVAGLASFDTLTQALMPPIAAALVHTVETNFVTPAVLGKRLTLDPFLVVLSLLVGTWLWGIGGAILAVPMLLFSVAAWRAYVLREPRKPPEAPVAVVAPALVPDAPAATLTPPVPAAKL